MLFGDSRSRYIVFLMIYLSLLTRSLLSDDRWTTVPLLIFEVSSFALVGCKLLVTCIVLEAIVYASDDLTFCFIENRWVPYLRGFNTVLPSAASILIGGSKFAPKWTRLTPWFDGAIVDVFEGNKSSCLTTVREFIGLRDIEGETWKLFAMLVFRDKDSFSSSLCAA